MLLRLKPETSDITEIYAYDPGGTTGFAQFAIDKENLRIVLVRLGEFQTWKYLDQHISELTKKPNAAIVYEGFRLRTIEANLIPVKVIGVLEYLSAKERIRAYEQLPYMRKVGKDSKGNEIITNWYPGILQFSSHSSSALRHGCVFITNHIFQGKIGKLVFDRAQLKATFLK